MNGVQGLGIPAFAQGPRPAGGGGGGGTGIRKVSLSAVRESGIGKT